MEQKRNTVRPDYKIMRMILNQCMRRNQNSVLFTVLIYAMLSAMALSIPLGIGHALISSGSIASALLSLLLSLCGIVIAYFLSYGRDVIMARLVEKKHATIGYMFNGFRGERKRVFRASLISMLITLGVLIICLTVTLPFFIPVFLGGGEIDTEKLYMVMLVFALLYIAVSLLATYPFIFVHILLYRMPGASVLECFGQSARLVFSQFFRLLGFIFYSAGSSLITLVIIVPVQVLLDAVGLSSAGAGGSILSLILAVAETVAEFSVLMRVYLAVPVYLFSMTGVLQIHKSEYVPPAPVPEIEEGMNEGIAPEAEGAQEEEKGEEPE